MNGKIARLLVLLFIVIVMVSSPLEAAVPDPVSNPNPSNGSTGVPRTQARLSWDFINTSGVMPHGYKVWLWEKDLDPAGFTFKFEMYGKRYYLSNSRANYTSAREACLAAGGVLAASFNDQINSLLRSNLSSESFWIGLSDATTEGSFLWENGRPYSWTKWNSGEPNNAGSGEDYTEVTSSGSWNDLEGSQSLYYYLELDGYLLNGEITGTRYCDLSTVLKPNSTYYWSVKPFNADGNASASVYSFTTIGTGTAPASTTISSPASGATNVALNPVLVWNQASGATYYKLYVWKSISNPDPYNNTLVGIYNGHSYYKSAVSSNWTTARDNCFNRQSYLMTIDCMEENSIIPADRMWIGMHDTGTEGELHWLSGEALTFTNWDTSEPNGSTEDGIEVYANGTWNDRSTAESIPYMIEYPGSVLDGYVTQGVQYQFQDINLEPNTTYNWVVIPHNNYGRPWVQGAYSFTTGPAGMVPEPITLMTPANGSVNVPVTITPSWTAPAGDPTEYYFYFGTNNGLTDATGFVDRGVLNGHHYYRSSDALVTWCQAEASAAQKGGYIATIGSLREHDHLKEAGTGDAYSRWFAGNDRVTPSLWKNANGEPWSFTKWGTGEPNDGSGTGQYYGVINFTADGSWDDQEGTVGRYYLLETIPNFASGARVTSTSFNPGMLNYNTTYYWVSVPANASGMASVPDYWTFTTQDGKPTDPSPADAAVDIHSKVFNWSGVAGASHYLFYLGSADGNWNLVNGEMRIGTDYTYGGELDEGQSYYWKVINVSPLGNVSSDTWSFTWGGPVQHSVFVQSTPSGAQIWVDAIEYPVTPYELNLDEGADATITVSFPDYSWELDELSDPNIITDLSSDRFLHFIGTYHRVEPSGFEFLGDPGVQLTGSFINPEDIPAPPPGLNAADDAVVMQFSGNEVTDLRVVVPEGTWYVIAYYSGEWHQASPYPCTHPQVALFTDVPFDAKVEVPVLITPTDATLPVELTSFTAVLTAQNMVKLVWATASETSTMGYFVFRSTTSVLEDALKISSLIEAFNSSEGQTYSYIDADATPGQIYYWLQSMDLGGSSQFFGPISINFSGGDEPSTPEIDAVDQLNGVYPNPFNPVTNIRYSLAGPDQVRLDIYNSRGQIIRSFSNNHASSGHYTQVWDGISERGEFVSSGVYYIVMRSSNYRSSSKMVILK